MICIVDSNVIGVSNNGTEHPDSCVVLCSKKLKEIKEKGKIVLDDSYLILGEYQSCLKTRKGRQPGPGDAFVKWVYSIQGDDRYCEHVKITRFGNQQEGIREFPSDPRLSDFDPADQKFIAVSVAHPKHPPVFQALDSKWWGFKDVLAECGVKVEFLCPEDIELLYRKKFQDGMKRKNKPEEK